VGAIQQPSGAKKHVVCFSGGHSSALTAIEVCRKYGNEDVILLNHDIHPDKEDADIKRFKQEVADYLELQITYANILGITDPEKIPNQFQVCMIAKAFKVNNGQELCTNRLKTAPFVNYMAANHPKGRAIVYYGFDADEGERIIRRTKHIESMGYKAAFPIAQWARAIFSTAEVGIEPPLTYGWFKHGNCKGCLKAGLQHWYVIFCLYPEIYQEGIKAEQYIGYTIHPDKSLTDLIPLFEAMQIAGITPTEHIPQQRFWADVRKFVKPKEMEGYVQNTLFMSKPCECVV
jgi:hypothetical protein